MPSLFDALPRPPRQRPFAAPQAAPGPGWMNAGGGMQQAPGGAPDASGRALNLYGPAGLLTQQLFLGMMRGGPNPWEVTDPALASKFFTPMTRKLLPDRYQKKPAT